MKMYFLRRQLWYEQFTSNGWDRVAGYLATALVFTMLTAYGLYGINFMLNAPPNISPISGGGLGNALLPKKPASQPESRLTPSQLPQVKQESAVKEGEPAGSDEPLLADDPATEYREDRPLWWNDLLGKQKPAQKPASGGILAEKPSGSPLGIEEIKPAKEVENDPIVVPPSRLLSIEEAGDKEPITLSKSDTKPRVTLEGFVNDTLSQSNHALGCWLLAVILEGFIVLLVVYNRPQYIG